MKKIIIPICGIVILLLSMSFLNFKEVRAIDENTSNIIKISGNKQYLFLQTDKLAPSWKVSSQKIILKNTQGDSINVIGRLSFSLNKKNLTKEQLEKMLDQYQIRLYLNDSPYLSEDWIPINKISNVSKEIGNLLENEQKELRFEIKLDEKAGNEYQAAMLNIKLSVGSKYVIPTSGEADSGSAINNEGSKLPKTATNLFNLLLVGISLIGIGVILHLNKRKDFLQILLRRRKLNEIIKEK